MAFTLDKILTRVRARVQDDTPFETPLEFSEHIDTALLQVDKDSAFRTVFDIVGDGGGDYALPATFQRGYDDVRDVEAPAGENPPLFRARNDEWFLYEDPTKPAGQQMRLRFKTLSVKIADLIRVTTLGPHTVNDTTSTLDPNQFLGVVYFASAEVFRSLAARFGQTTDSTIAADAVDYAGKTQSFLFSAERSDRRYKEIIGLGEGTTKPAQVLGEFDMVHPQFGDMLFRPRRWR